MPFTSSLGDDRGRIDDTWVHKEIMYRARSHLGSALTYNRLEGRHPLRARRHRLGRVESTIAHRAVRASISDARPSLKGDETASCWPGKRSKCRVLSLRPVQYQFRAAGRANNLVLRAPAVIVGWAGEAGREGVQMTAVVPQA